MNTKFVMTQAGWDRGGGGAAIAIAPWALVDDPAGSRGEGGDIIQNGGNSFGVLETPANTPVRRLIPESRTALPLQGNHHRRIGYQCRQAFKAGEAFIATLDGSRWSSSRTNPHGNLTPHPFFERLRNFSKGFCAQAGNPTSCRSDGFSNCLAECDGRRKRSRLTQGRTRGGKGARSFFLLFFFFLLCGSEQYSTGCCDIRIVRLERVWARL